MEIFAAAIALVTEVVHVRGLYLEAMSPEKRRELADRQADVEIQSLDRWLAFLESVRPK